MNKRILSKTAFTLLELIIASALAVIVLFGIASFNSLLSNNNQDYGQRYSVKSATQVTLNHILNNASMAIGTGTTIYGQYDLGILIGTGNNGTDPGVSDLNSFCIHQDIPPGPYTFPTTIDNAPANGTPGPGIPPSSTPPYYTNSRWLCYTWSPSTFQINYCAMAYAYNNNPYRGAGSCPTNGSQYLGTAYGTATTGAFATASFNSTSGFSITITNCLDNTLALGPCSSTNNPQAILSGSVVPSQEGMKQN